MHHAHLSTAALLTLAAVAVALLVLTTAVA